MDLITADDFNKTEVVKYKPLDYNYKPTEYPPWRQDGSTLPSVSEMVGDIVAFREEWLKIKETCAKGNVDKLLDEMKTRFILHVNVGEGIGTQTLEETKAVLKERTNTPSVKRSGSKSVTETKNIQLAMDFMAKIVNEETDERMYLGLLEQGALIKGVHKELMTGVNECTTKPGHYSSNARSAEYKGEIHDYPEFKNEQEAEKHVQVLIDIYNDAIEYIKDIADERKKIEMAFKCAAWFFFEFVSLHPFGDGNGRLSRLLCSYILSVITPFPTSIYNIYGKSKKSDYVDAIVSARKSEGRHPCDLAAMIIECNWSGWKYFIGKLKTEE